MNSSKNKEQLRATATRTTANTRKGNSNNVNCSGSNNVDNQTSTTTTKTTATSIMKIKEKEKEDAPSPQPEKVLYDNRIKRKNVLALNEKVAAIREYEKMPVYKRIGRMFHCSPDQIKRIVQQKDNILKAWEQRTRRCQDTKTLELKVVRVSMLGKAVYDWIRRMMYYKDLTISDGLIQKMALQFKSAMGLKSFFPHPEWCENFRHTYKITSTDSKLLNIGYTQGYSVQIKDVIKDVLSECTPGGEAAGDLDSSLDGDDDEDNEVGESGSEKEGADNRDTKDHLVLAKSVGLQQQQQQQQQQQPQQQRIALQHQPISLPQLPIRQLVALPIKTNSGITQKVLVATPITPASSQRPGGGTGAPMTMTIIPFTTLAQTQNVGQAVTIGAAATSTSVPATAPSTIPASERQSIPPPIIEIKQEIKKEPEDIEIKQEYISEDEAQDTLQTVPTTATTAVAGAAATAAELPEGAAVKVNVTQPRSRLAGLDDASIIDDDNMALANLRQLIKQPIAASTAGSSTRTARTKQMSLKLLSSEQTSSRAPTSLAVSEPTVSLAIRSARTPAIGTRSAHKRKHGNDTPAMTRIQSCGEARRHLKLLEEFALLKENYRLIDLIARADEVLRELDGDNDVDID